ncbi:alginate lyase family protein [Asticcacaulis sp. EMRT-3]|uniref:alginate lyase family protein n=1 Tax=Asticcacaulis sp. EMRT-3 TaxID=3040349 RepID=UPI0024AF1BE8|nr:alginate lyase family protein [Asticcacaulis sp. EMRT-3]MDI7776335.1 alginate lyase family protein [Asticcacaulis sp. EMRT-3]
MRGWILAGVVTALAAGPQAPTLAQTLAQTEPQTPPSSWCDVSPADAAAALPAALPHLADMLARQPHPLARLHTEGTLPHHGIRDESIAAKRDLPIMRDAALAWRAGVGDAYLALAERYLKAWVATYQPGLNPIDETGFDALIDTYAIIGPQMDTASRDAAKTFLTRWAKAYIASIDGHKIVSISPQAKSWTNNWQSHRIKLITMMAVTLDDDALFADARRLYQAQIAANIGPDGEVSDFAERDALHYVIYDLEPLTQAALVARRRGEDWFSYQSPSGSSLAGAIRWLEPYASGEKPHTEFLHSKTVFDAQRAAAGEPGYSGPFDPKTAGNLMWAASRFDANYLDLARRLKPQAPAYLVLCGQ